MKLIQLFLALLTVSVLTSCKDDDEPTVSDNRKTVSTTVLAYFIGENDLNSYLQNNIREMKEGMKNAPRGANLLVYLDNGTAPTLTCISTDERGNVTENVVKTYSDQYSTDPKIMRQVINDAFSLYPADSLGLILSSHASGSLYSSASYKDLNTDEEEPAVRSFGSEYVTRPGQHPSANWSSYTMNITDLAEGLSEIPQLQYIMFDACLMGNLETAYELRHVARYLIASPNSVPASGYPYQKIMSSLCSMSLYDLTSIADTYITTYYTNASTWDDFAACSIFDMSKLDGFAQSFQAMMQEEKTLERIEAVSRLDMQLYEADSSTPTENPDYPLYDLALLIDSIAPTEEYATRLRSELRNVIVCYRHLNYLTVTSENKLILPYDSRRSCGLTTYIPPFNAYSEYSMRIFYKQLSWYTDAGMSRSPRFNVFSFGR